ncbi:MAG: hypothetical protein ISQ70_14705, partial [Pirellulales bacterium]|nr:hypothetical protein [Pirellulales bacterium]
MAALGGFGANVPGEIDLEAVAAWYVDHAPEELPPPQAAAVDTAPQFQPRVALPLPDIERLPFVSSLCVADLGGPGEPSLVICDMHNGGVWRGSATAAAWLPQKIADLPSPARAEAVDLDQDGRMDLVVAVLGSPMAMDHLLGQVVWLRQTSDGA